MHLFTMSLATAFVIPLLVKATPPQQDISIVNVKSNSVYTGHTLYGSNSLYNRFLGNKYILNNLGVVRTSGSGIDSVKHQALLAGVNDLMKASPEKYGEISKFDRQGIAESIVNYLPSISQDQLDQVDYMIATFIEDFNRADVISPITFVNRPAALGKRDNEENYKDEECRGYEPPEFLVKRGLRSENSPPKKIGFLDSFIQTVRNDNAEFIERTRDSVDAIANDLKPNNLSKATKKKLEDLRLIIGNFTKPFYSAAIKAGRNPQLMITKDGDIVFSQDGSLENIHNAYIHVGHTIQRLNDVKDVISKETLVKVRNEILADESKKNNDKSIQAWYKDITLHQIM